MTLFVGQEMVTFPAPQKPDPKISQRALNLEMLCKKGLQRLLTRVSNFKHMKILVLILLSADYHHCGRVYIYDTFCGEKPDPKISQTALNLEMLCKKGPQRLRTRGFKLQTHEDFGFDPTFRRQSSLWEGIYLTLFVGQENWPFPAPQKPDPKISQRAFNPEMVSDALVGDSEKVAIWCRISFVWCAKMRGSNSSTGLNFNDENKHSMRMMTVMILVVRGPNQIKGPGFKSIGWVVFYIVLKC